MVKHTLIDYIVDYATLSIICIVVFWLIRKFMERHVGAKCENWANLPQENEPLLDSTSFTDPASVNFIGITSQDNFSPSISDKLCNPSNVFNDNR